MSINFPLFLVIATGLTGFIWLVDLLVLRQKRRLAVSRLVAGTEAAAEVESAASAVDQQPVLVEYSIQFFPVLLVDIIWYQSA